MTPVFHQLTQQQLDAITLTPATFIFSGPAGSGKALAARLLAQRLNCQSDQTCDNCRRIQAGGFPDFIATQPTGKAITIDEVKLLQQRLANRPLNTDTLRITVIDASDGITDQAQNRLLKTLEEPPAQTVIIVLSPVAESLLPTAVSRARVIEFRPLTKAQIKDFIASSHGPIVAEAVMQLRPVSIGQAVTLAANPEILSQRAELDAQSQQFLNADLFDRLQMIANRGLSDKVPQLVETLASRSRGGAINILPVLDQAQAELGANLSGRTVLEALALRL